MGTWGYRLYEDDQTLDLRGDFEDHMREGKSLEETLKLITKAYDLEGDPKEDPNVEVAWFALADTLWRCGRLTEEIKERVMEYLEDSEDLKRWEEENPDLAPKRKKELEKLKEKLNREQPPVKRFGKKREVKEYVCPWRIGDVYAYPMVGPASEGTEFYGRYAIFIKVDVKYRYGNYLPVVWIKLTKGNQLPSTAEEIEALEFVQWALHNNTPFLRNAEDDIQYYTAVYHQKFTEEQVKKQKEYVSQENRREIDRFDHSKDYLNDRNRNLHIYRVVLYNISKRMTPKSLIYLGNFSITPPPMEYDDPYEAPHWKFFEESLIEQYRKNKSYNESVGWPEEYLNAGKSLEHEDDTPSWKNGDVYAYPMVGPASEGTAYYGRYAILIIVDTERRGAYRPDVWIKLTKGNQLPSTAEEIESLEFVQWGEESNALPQRDAETEIQSFLSDPKFDITEDKIKEIKEDVANYNKWWIEHFNHSRDYMTDRNGNMHKYRVILNSSIRGTVPKSLVYLGNYSITPPPLEYEHLLDAVLWKDFEERLINRYEKYKKYNQEVGWPEDYL